MLLLGLCVCTIAIVVSVGNNPVETALLIFPTRMENDESCVAVALPCP